ncbi:iron/manganese superoxide dismutase-like protein [Paraburkholderia unamae]|nr:iron/manganese superoxide dismutase-like protein [Paraburkholderia unamae]
MILQCENHQKLTAWGIQPILVVDVFEHAYDLKYQNRRNEYVNDGPAFESRQPVRSIGTLRRSSI